jgi:MFS-type transporter involved in bile tolerance (Atg22 family)
MSHLPMFQMVTDFLQCLPFVLVLLFCSRLGHYEMATAALATSVRQLWHPQKAAGRITQLILFLVD